MVSKLDYRQLINVRDTSLCLLGGDVKVKPKLNNSSTRPGITNKILCNKNSTNKNR